MYCFKPLRLLKFVKQAWKTNTLTQLKLVSARVRSQLQASAWFQSLLSVCYDVQREKKRKKEKGCIMAEGLFTLSHSMAGEARQEYLGQILLPKLST